ncbi:IS630 family transposase [Imhoffiella purpurea]|uniref:Transposase, IS630 family n=1 Tax=Imhoffiella purpurea TaxID=1249627 RepID=W9VJB5_9GAMM|nr:IS630 family transposase [Imhoffiella purpurea]EXJ16152.1 transposase, IS630 family [Imhoffiella purpurea]
MASAAAPSVQRDPQTKRLEPNADLASHTAPPRWTLKRLVAWIEGQFGQRLSRETVRRALKRLGFSWKKAKALLNRANTAVREAFVAKLQALLRRTLGAEPPLLVYIDEAHIHQDADLGYGWAPRGERLWVGSHSPGLAAKVSFYGLYFYNTAQVAIWDFPRANTEHTLSVLRRLREQEPTRELILIWDGASYHRSIAVRDLAEELSITVLPLPGYSPDFMPVEALWRWLREDVTYHHCHATAEELIARVDSFAHAINTNPMVVADRLWTKTELDPEEEKLRIPG